MINANTFCDHRSGKVWCETETAPPTVNMVQHRQCWDLQASASLVCVLGEESEGRMIYYSSYKLLIFIFMEEEKQILW